MTQLRLVLVLAIVVSTAVCSSAVCCPTCTTRSIPRLSPSQRQEVLQQAAFIRRLEAEPDLLLNAENQRSLVKLTVKQRTAVLRNFPQIFTARPPPALGNLSVPVTEEHCQQYQGPECPDGCVVADNGTCHAARDCTLSSDGRSCRRRRNAAGYTRVCPPVHNDSPLILVRKPNGQVVELIQMPDQSHNQWILEEDCMHLTHHDKTCGLAERSVTGLFINLSGIVETGGSPQDFDFAEVIVHCCVVVTQP